MLFLLGCHLGLSTLGDRIVAGETPDSGPASVADLPIDQDLVGAVYHLSAASLAFTAPSGLEGQEASFFPRDLLFYVADQAGSRLQWVVVEGDGAGNQDHCMAAHNLAVADWSLNPAFALGPADLSLTATPFTWQNLRLYGVFSQDASYWDRGRFTADVDLRELQTTLPEASCDWAIAADGSCGRCADGEEFCVAVQLEVSSVERVGSAVDPRESGDCQ